MPSAVSLACVPLPLFVRLAHNVHKHTRRTAVRFIAARFVYVDLARFFFRPPRMLSVASFGLEWIIHFGSASEQSIHGSVAPTCGAVFVALENPLVAHFMLVTTQMMGLRDAWPSR